MEKINFFKLANFTPKQKLFLEFTKTYRYTLFGGVLGSGKSFSLRWIILYWLLYWGAKGFKNIQAGLFCRTYPELNDRHLKRIKTEFPEWLGTYYEQKSEFHLRPEYGGGILMFRNLDEVEKYRCFSEDTEVLVRSKGFISIKDLQEGDFCLSLNPKTKIMEWNRVKKMYVYDYDREMIDYFGRFGVSFCVTPNHRMLIRTSRNKNLRFVLAKNLPQRFYVPVTGKWKGEKISEKIIFKSDGNNGKTIECSLEDFLRFLGWFLAEGCVSNDGNRYEIKITQCHGKNHKKISEMLNKLGVNWHYNGKDYTFNNKSLYLYLRQFGKSSQKFIPQEFKDLPPRYLKILLEGLILGDGTKYSKNKMVFVTTSEKLRDDVTEICLKLGYSVTCLTKEETEGRIAGGKLCKWRKSFHLTINKRNAERACAKFYPERFLENKKYKTSNFKKIHYKGKIYGPVVPPYYNILIRHRGRTMFIGQSAEFAIVGVDELVQIPKETFDLLVERNRWPELTNPKFLAVTNPVGEFSNWVREFFIEKTSKDQRCKEAGYLKAEIGDNPYLPENYYQELSKGMDEKLKKALLEGDWYSFEGEMDNKGYLALISSRQLDEAIVQSDYPLSQPCILGVDVGAGGNATAMIVRDQLTAKVLFNQRLSDTMAILPKIAELYSVYNFRIIAIDITGVGKGIYDRLNETGLFNKTYGVIFGSKADDQERFFNKKAELYWKAREWILKGGKLIENEAWKEALTIRYKIQSDRKIKIEPKESLLKKGIASPNVWDAFALTFIEDLNQLKFYDETLWET
jgi:hypothetical protein